MGEAEQEHIAYHEPLAKSIIYIYINHNTNPSMQGRAAELLGEAEQEHIAYLGLAGKGG